MTETIFRRGYRTEKVAPEGGWGYLIAIGLTLPFSLSVGGMHSFGLVFNDFLTSLGAETSAVTIIMGALYSAQSFSALFASSLFRKFSMRSVGTVGAILYFLGHLLTVFATSVEMLIVTFGVLQGLGLGLMVPVGYTSFTHYFVKRRVFMMSVTQAMKGIVITSHKILPNILMNMFGFRGTLAIIAALNAHAIFGMLAMHPVDWHMKTVRILEIEMKPLMKTEEAKNENVSDIPNEKEKENVNESVENVDKVESVESIGNIGSTIDDLAAPNEVNIDVMLDEDHTETGKTERQRRNMLLNTITWSGISRDKILRRIERSKSLTEGSPMKEFDEFDPLRRRIASIMSLSDFGGDIIPMKSFDSLKPGFWQKVVEFLDLNLMKDLIYVNIVLGISFTTFADNTFFPLLPMYLDTLGFSKNEAAKIVSVGAGADLVSRISLAFLSLCVEPEARYVFLAGAIATIMMRCVIVAGTFEYFAMMAIAGLTGFFRTWIHVPIALIFADHLPPERFAAGYGLYMFLQGNFTFVIGPFFGWIRDITHSYIIFFKLLSITTGLCVIPWLIEIVWFKIYPKNSNN